MKNTRIITTSAVTRQMHRKFFHFSLSTRAKSAEKVESRPDYLRALFSRTYIFYFLPDIFRPRENSPRAHATHTYIYTCIARARLIPGDPLSSVCNGITVRDDFSFPTVLIPRTRSRYCIFPRDLCDDWSAVHFTRTSPMHSQCVGDRKEGGDWIVIAVVSDVSRQ